MISATTQEHYAAPVVWIVCLLGAYNSLCNTWFYALGPEYQYRYVSADAVDITGYKEGDRVVLAAPIPERSEILCGNLRQRRCVIVNL